MARLLTPSSRGWDKKRFELGLEDRIYLACPMFEREEGGWTRRKKQRTKEKEREKNLQNGQDRTEDVGGVGVDNAATGYEEDGVDGYQEDSANSSLKGESFASEEGKDAIISTATPSMLVPRPGTTGKAYSSDDHLVPASLTTTATSESLPSQSSSVAAHALPQSLAMFNLVFVLESGEHLDPDTLVKDMYTHVVRKLAKALKWTQKRYGWLWSESQNILRVREKGKERGISTVVTFSNVWLTSYSSAGVSYKSLWPSIAAKSSLARCISATFESIKHGDLVHLTLGPSKSPLRVSLQIQQVVDTDLAPSPMVSQPRGLFTTTYDPFSLDALTTNAPSGAISAHSALILLTSRSSILAELTENGAVTSSSSPLAQYLRHSIPTKSLARLSKATRLSLVSIQALSMHLILWRRAMAIPPLHSSQTYVVNPNADFSRLREASDEYDRRFPSLPSLVTMLGKLSGTGNRKLGPGISAIKIAGPRPYGSFIPSLDHKTAYMEILEWLMRQGWVTQLKTFAWVRVSPEIKASVARQVARDEEEVEEADQVASNAVFSDEEVVHPESSGHRKHSSGGSVATPAFSPRLRALLGPPRAMSETGSTSSAKTTVRISSLQVPSSPKAMDPHSNDRRHRLSDESTTSRIHLSPDDHDDTLGIKATDFEPSIVLSPHHAGALESRWLKQVGESLPSEDLRTAWPKLVRHFDGKHALEEIALSEGWKRKTTTPMLLKLVREEHGVLLTVQHW